jgi:hypothetical protein
LAFDDGHVLVFENNLSGGFGEQGIGVSKD